MSHKKEEEKQPSGSVRVKLVQTLQIYGWEKIYLRPQQVMKCYPVNKYHNSRKTEWFFLNVTLLLKYLKNYVTDTSFLKHKMSYMVL